MNELPRAHASTRLRLVGARVNSLISAVVAGMTLGMLALFVLSQVAPGQLLGRVAPAMVASLGASAGECHEQLQLRRKILSSAKPSTRRAPAACPDDMALVDGEFCPLLNYSCVEFMDDAEYRCSQYARGQRCGAAGDARRYCIDRHEWPNRVGEQPTVFVDWNQAKDMCASAGKRLCSRSEWVLACEGPKRLPYPWGYRRRPSPCNIDRPAIPFDVNAMMKPATREGELARLWQADPIGSHPDCVSAFGDFDLAGNVDEWTDNARDDPGTSRPSTLNGGYWGPVRDTCRLTTKSHRPNFRFYQVGFRCCRDPLTGPKTKARPWIEPEDD